MTKHNKKTNVVPFGSVEAERADDKPSYGEILAMLVEMDDVEYDRCRHARAAEWGIQLETLDKIRKQARTIRTYNEAKHTEPDPNEDRLQRILNTEGILDLWLKSWDKVMAGEHRNAKLLYLIATSRMLEDTMHAAIKGPSSAGKSQIRKQVLSFFPPEDVISFTTMGEKALLYEEREFSHKILSMGEACDAKSLEVQNMLLRELMSEQKLVHRVPQFVHGKWVTIPIIKHGPVTFMVTTTRAALHPENETRMISLEVDDSERQTHRVMAKQAQTLGMNIRPDDGIHLDWMDFQRVLRKFGNKKVTVPFAAALAALIPPRATRLRRDYPQVIACIKTHTLIHCYRRVEENGELIADLELDYVPVAELMGHLVSEGAGIAVSAELLDTITALKGATVKIPSDDGATAYEISKLLGLDKSTALRRLRVAVEKGFAVNLEQRRGQPGKYRLTDQEVEAENLLPSADEIMAWTPEK